MLTFNITLSGYVNYYIREVELADRNMSQVKVNFQKVMSYK